jgi:hypothetical protein
MRRREPDGGSPGASEGVGPEEGHGARPSARRGEPATVSGARPPRGGGGILAAWMAWLRSQPLMAGVVLGFCIVALGGLILSLPAGMLFPVRTGRSARGASATSPTTPASAPSPVIPPSRIPDSPSGETPSARSEEPGPWVEAAPSPRSARGLALVYRYRVLPPGGESRYQWIVQIRGARPVLDGIDVVSWQMEPPAKDGADLTSRDRAADGFPLFGDGPGGWFGVSARIRYRDGQEETLSRRIELSE